MRSIGRASLSLLLLPLTFSRVLRAEEPPTSTSGSAIEFTSLTDLKEKGALSDDDFASAKREAEISTGARAEKGNTLVVGGWATTFYGFVETDVIYDTTQSFLEAAGNQQVERPAPYVLDPPAPQTTYRGDHDRMTFSIRNSRLGISTRSPKAYGANLSAMIEFDLLGQQPPIGYATPQLNAQNQGPAAGQTTEFTTFTMPLMRLRHGYFKIESPIVDVLVGQYWQLFGWVSNFQPNTVEIQGVPGQLYARAPQIRVSKTFRTKPVTLDLAVAAGHPPQRDSARPDLQMGVKMALNQWTGMHTNAATATTIAPLSLGVSAVSRQFTVPEFSALPSETVNKTMAAVAIDALIPVLPARADKKGNSLTLVGEFVNGAGIADFYSNMTGGMLMPSVANTTNLNPPPTYPQNIDNGLVVFDLNGDLHGIKWRTFVIGAEYYLPFMDGRMWVSANYSHSVSDNAKLYTRPATGSLPNPQDSFYVSAAQVRDHIDWYDVNVFADVLGPVRMGAEYAVFVDTYVDGVKATNQRVQLSTYFLF